MKNIEIPDDVYAALARVARDHGKQPGEILGALFGPQAPAGQPTGAVSELLLSREFLALQTPDAKYLAVLTWVATQQPADFAEFVEREPSARRYLRFTRDEILESCRNHATQQIDGTRYWAIMNIGVNARRQFVLRLFDFIGYDAMAADAVCATIGLVSARRASRLLVA